MKNKNKERENKKKNNMRWIIGIVVAGIISFLSGGVLAPILGAYFGEAFSPKPTVHILRDATCIVPNMAQNQVLTKTAIKNVGSAPEVDLIVRWEVVSPWVFENNSTWFEYQVDRLPAGQTTMLVKRADNPSVSQLHHGSFKITIRIFGATKVWDTAEFSLSW